MFYDGKSLARGRNPVPATRGQVQQAKDLYSDFSGHDPKGSRKVKLRNPKAGFVIGKLDGVLYTAVRDGKKEKYIHEFKPSAAPNLVSSFDGHNLYIIGGKYTFRETGINDN